MFSKITLTVNNPFLKSRTFKNPSLEKMYKFYKDYYVPNNMVLALSGDFDSEKIIPLLMKI